MGPGRCINYVVSVEFSYLRTAAVFEGYDLFVGSYIMRSTCDI